MTQTVGLVQEFGTTQKGSPKVKISGGWYFAGKTDISYMKEGQKVEFDFSTFGDKNQFKGINQWRAVEEAPQGNGVHAPAPRPASAQPTPASATGDLVFLATEHLPFVSNTIAHAIAAGHIKEPADLHKWVEAARHAITGKEWLPF